MQKFRVMIEDDIFLELLDTEGFPLVWDILEDGMSNIIFRIW